MICGFHMNSCHGSIRCAACAGQRITETLWQGSDAAIASAAAAAWSAQGGMPEQFQQRRQGAPRQPRLQQRVAQRGASSGASSEAPQRISGAAQARLEEFVG